MQTVYVDLDETIRRMKAELRREFPATRFSVRRNPRNRGTPYGYVSVRWTDGPTTKRVKEITELVWLMENELFVWDWVTVGVGYVRGSGLRRHDG